MKGVTHIFKNKLQHCFEFCCTMSGFRLNVPLNTCKLFNDVHSATNMTCAGNCGAANAVFVREKRRCIKLRN
jgi:hypothetical protein